MSVDQPAFVDTNILVYCYDSSDPQRQSVAEQLVSGLLDDDRVRFSTQVFQEFYVTMTRKIAAPWAPADALAILDALAAWPVFATDFDAVREAINLSVAAQISFWDSLVVVAAKRSGAVVLFTEDLNHGQVIAGVEVRNPFM